MDASYFISNETDEFLVSQYKDFLPRKIFDAHMHLPLGVTIPASQGTGVYFRDAFTPEDYLSDLGPLLPGVEKIRHVNNSKTQNCKLRVQAFMLYLNQNGRTFAGKIMEDDSHEIRFCSCFRYPFG